MNFKKLILPVILFLMLMPFMVNAETCDLDKITIDSVTIKEKTDNVTEVEQPIIEGKKIKVNLKVMEVNDSIEYKITIKNDSNEDYELGKNSLNVNSDYIEYTLKTADDGLIVKSGETKDVYLKVQYKNEVPDNEFSDGKFNDNKSFVLNLSNDQTIEVPDTIKNPKTGDSLIFLMLICILCVGITMYMVLSRKKINKFMVLLLTLMITIPASVYALCKIEISIESNVTIEKGYEVGYLNTSRGWYTDDELAKYQKTQDTECDVVYKGEEKYNVCSNIIIKDNKLYAPGETVTLKTQNIRYFDTWDDENDTNLCTEQSDGLYQCPSNMEEDSYTINYWYYDNLWNRYGFTYNSTDKQVMNFSNLAFDYWDSAGYFRVEAPQTFTMPNHSVLFGKPVPG